MSAYFSIDRTGTPPLSLDFVRLPHLPWFFYFLGCLFRWHLLLCLEALHALIKPESRDTVRCFNIFSNMETSPLWKSMLIIPTIDPPLASWNTSSLLLCPSRWTITCYRSSYLRIFISYNYVHRLPLLAFAKAVTPQVCHPTFQSHFGFNIHLLWMYDFICPKTSDASIQWGIC